MDISLFNTGDRQYCMSCSTSETSIQEIVWKVQQWSKLALSRPQQFLYHGYQPQTYLINTSFSLYDICFLIIIYSILGFLPVTFFSWKKLMGCWDHFPHRGNGRINLDMNDERKLEKFTEHANKEWCVYKTSLIWLKSLQLH